MNRSKIPPEPAAFDSVGALGAAARNTGADAEKFPGCPAVQRGAAPGEGRTNGRPDGLTPEVRVPDTVLSGEVASPGPAAFDSVGALLSALRAAAREALPHGAFLRLDRGDALFVTDAPLRERHARRAAAPARADVDKRRGTSTCHGEQAACLAVDRQCGNTPGSRAESASVGADDDARCAEASGSPAAAPACAVDEGPCGNTPGSRAESASVGADDDARCAEASGSPAAALTRAGFEVSFRGTGLLALRPGPEWLSALAAAHPEPADFLCASLKRFDAPAEPESLELFAAGLKSLAAGDRAAYARKLRQRAAVCLRDGGGAGLYACALLLRPDGGTGET